MTIRDATLQRLEFARNTFYCSAASYALLTSPVTGPVLKDRKLIFRESGFEVLPTGETAAPPRLGLTIRFADAISEGPARAMMEVVYQKMISDSVEATRAYARSRGELNLLIQEEWFAVAQHLRNAFSHGGKWSFRRGHPPLPAMWNYKFTVIRDMAGRPALGFLPWFWGTRLCGQMDSYVRGIVDFRQQRLAEEAAP